MLYFMSNQFNSALARHEGTAMLPKQRHTSVTDQHFHIKMSSPLYHFINSSLSLSLRIRLCRILWIRFVPDVFFHRTNFFYKLTESFWEPLSFSLCLSLTHGHRFWFEPTYCRSLIVKHIEEQKYIMASSLIYILVCDILLVLVYF